MYADDVQMYTSCNIQDLNSGFENRVWQWAAGNGLSLNPSKSKSIVITRNKLDSVSLPQIAVRKVFDMVRTLWVTQKFTPLHIRMILAKSFLLPML